MIARRLLSSDCTSNSKPPAAEHPDQPTSHLTDSRFRTSHSPAARRAVVGLAQDRRCAVKIYPGMPAPEKKRGAEGKFLAKDLSIWRQPPGPEADSGSRIQELANHSPQLSSALLLDINLL